MSVPLREPASLTGLSPAGTTRAARWTSYALTGIAALFLALDAAMKLMAAPPSITATVQLGFAPQQVPVIGAIGVVCLVLYLVPRTAVLGAVLWTGYLGGAVAANLRVGNPLWTHTLFPIYVAALVWGGLYLRDPRARVLLRPTR